MFRKFLASFLLGSFSVIVFPLLLFGVFFSTLGNPSFIREKILPQSYETVMKSIAKRMKEGNSQGKNSPNEKWLFSTFPKETYVGIVSGALDDFTMAFRQPSPSGVTGIDFKNTKAKFLRSLENGIRALPVCEGPSSPGPMNFSCFPREIPPSEKESTIRTILHDLDAGIPSHVSFPKPLSGKPLAGITFVLHHRLMITLFLVLFPFLLLSFIPLVLFGQWKRATRMIGSGLLGVSFEAFIGILLLSTFSNFLTDMSSVEAESREFLMFLSSFPLRWFQIMTISFAVLGIGAFFLPVKNREEDGLLIEEISSSIPRNGKLRRGSKI